MDYAREILDARRRRDQRIAKAKADWRVTVAELAARRDAEIRRLVGGVRRAAPGAPRAIQRASARALARDGGDVNTPLLLLTASRSVLLTSPGTRSPGASPTVRPCREGWPTKRRKRREGRPAGASQASRDLAARNAAGQTSSPRRAGSTLPGLVQA